MRSVNFLAHLYLAEPTPGARIGSLLPDLCRIGRDTVVPAELATGVTSHRRVDAFTDSHPIVAQSKNRLFPACGRSSGIVLDVLYDHFLACDWSAWSSAPLRDFVGEVHHHIISRADLIPPMAYPVFARMIDQQWLLSYGTVAGLRLCLVRMSRRFTQRFGREVALEGALNALAEHRAALQADFASFFPQLVAHARVACPVASLAAG